MSTSVPTPMVFQNACCTLTFQADAAAGGKWQVSLLDRRTGLRLAGALCEVDAMWSAVQRVEVQGDVSVLQAVRTADNEARFVLRAARAHIEFALVVSLTENEFTVRVPWDSVVEERQEFFRLFGVRPFAGLLTAANDDTLLAPVRSGALIRLATRPRFPVRDQFLIYGQQCRWEDLPLLPVCAQYAEDRHGIAVIAEEGDCDTQYEIEITAAGSAVSGFSCRYRYLWPDPVDAVDRVLRYVLLDGPAATYSGVGRRLNRFVREAWHVPTLREKCERSPEVRYIAGAMTFKTFHAMKDLERPHGDGVYHCFQTFAETAEQLRRLKAAGIENAYFQLTGWNIDGHDGRYPIRFPVDPRLGGDEGFRELLRCGQGLGYQMQVHDDYAEGPRSDSRATIRTWWGDPLARGIWAGGTNYSYNPIKLGEVAARRDMLRLRALGVAGVFYLDAMGPPLEIDYDPQRGGPRRRHADGIRWILAQGRAVFGGAGTENGFAYAVRDADYLGNVPLRDVWSGLKSATPIQALVDEWVPLWHLTFHGMLVHSTCDDASPSLAKLLEAADTGGSPRSDFSGPDPDPEGTLLAIQWDERLLPAYKAKYDILLGRLGETQLAFIEQHRHLGGQAYRTTFSNGCTVDVDYAAKRLTVDGKAVPIPPVFDLNLPMRRAAASR